MNHLDVISCIIIIYITEIHHIYTVAKLLQTNVPFQGLSYIKKVEDLVIILMTEVVML